MAPAQLSTVNGNTFVISDPIGNVIDGAAHGLFVADTRYLSRFELSIQDTGMTLLRSGATGRGSTEVYATNAGSGSLLPHTLEVRRRRSIGVDLSERIELTNRGDAPSTISVALVFDADFADIFEVRSGAMPQRPRRCASWADGVLMLADRRRPEDRQVRISLDPAPDQLEDETACYTVRLQPGERWSVTARVSWTIPDSRSCRPVPVHRLSREDGPAEEWLAGVPSLDTNDPTLLAAYNQAVRDLADLEIALDSGHSILAAGLPWYMAIFGRDSIISSLQSLLTGPRHAHGTLQALAAYQSTGRDDFRDSEPGKFPHEVRFGELALSESIPHAAYYGTADATPLWLVLLALTMRWSDRLDLAHELLPAATAALDWIESHGDLDGDGFIEYQTRSPGGLINQGWKDSWDGVRFADGTLAEAPIALVEVQGYAVAARRALAEVHDALGDPGSADRLRGEGDRLKEQIQDAFWMPEHGYFALGLDGRKRQVDSITSNPGHLLWSEAVDEPYAAWIVERLMSPELFSGWGVRTLATDMRAYNPFSYHNGSVWPHDNSLIVAGMAGYGYGQEAMRVIDGLLDATMHFEHRRLPELFCGYAREDTPFPVNYPAACAPQAWASGAIILLLQTMAGVKPNGNRLRVSPLSHGRRLELGRVPFRGKLWEISSDPDRAGARLT